MKRLAILLVCLSFLGCKKKWTDTELEPDEKPRIIPKSTGNLSVGTGGSGGAVQATRKAAARIANLAQLQQLHQFIAAAETANGQVPNANEIMQEIAQAHQILALVKDEVIILTNNTQRDGIWAYTQWPQRAGDHYVIMASGVQQMAPAQLRQTLQTQGSTIKMSQ